MPEWWTYRLADAQVFPAGAYAHLVQHCNQQAWPAQPVAALLCLSVLALLAWRPAAGARALGASAALAQAGVAAWWLPHCYAQLHWASAWLAWGFALQAALLAAWAAGPARWRRAPDFHAGAGAALVVLVALALLPWLGSPPGAGPPGWEWPGLQPAPTLAVALAVLPLAVARWRWALLPLPLAGVAVEALTQAATGRPPWVLLPLLLVLGGLAVRHRAKPG